MSSYFPIYFDLKDKECLVIGGGEIAFRKIESLLEYGAKITCVTKEIISMNIINLSSENRVKLVQKPVSPEDCLGFFLVIAATNDYQVNSMIYEYLKSSNVLINCVDDTKNSNFIFPAVLKHGLLNIAVSTSGASPSLAKIIRNKIAEIFDSKYGELLEIFRRKRELSSKTIFSDEKRSSYLKEIASVIDIEKEIDIEEIRNELSLIDNKYLHKKEEG